MQIINEFMLFISKKSHFYLIITESEINQRMQMNNGENVQKGKNEEKKQNME